LNNKPDNLICLTMVVLRRGADTDGLFILPIRQSINEFGGRHTKTKIPLGSGVLTFFRSCLLPVSRNLQRNFAVPSIIFHKYLCLIRHRPKQLVGGLGFR
jgi:hypothetical protein